jgi:hypothetical protein
MCQIGTGTQLNEVTTQRRLPRRFSSVSQTECSSAQSRVSKWYVFYLPKSLTSESKSIAIDHKFYRMYSPIQFESVSASNVNINHMFLYQ